MNLRNVFLYMAAFLALGMFSSCSVNRFIPEGAYLLDKVSIRCDSNAVSTGTLEGYIRQHPNSRWLSLAKMPMRIYSLSGRDSTKRINRFIRRLGEAPVIYNPTQAQKTCDNLHSAVCNLGYLNADVDLLLHTHKRKARVTYQIYPGIRYKIATLAEDIQDSTIRQLMESDSTFSIRVTPGKNFDMNVLDAERDRITNYLNNRGYYRFNKDFIRYSADTAIGRHLVDLTLRVLRYRAPGSKDLLPHPYYRIGNIVYSQENTPDGKNFIRKNVLTASTKFHTGELYNEKRVQDTYDRLIRLAAVQSAHVNFEEVQDSVLNARISITPSKPNSFNVELEGTNSAGDLGAALGLSYQNRNIFKGSEVLTVKLRGAFEAIKGLSGYVDQNYIEYSAETRLTFPNFKFPFLSERFKRSIKATSEVRLMFDSQNRPEFHRRVVTAAWLYKWDRMERRLQHRFDLLDLNYVFMPWISSTFRELYLDDPNSRNAILRYNYENLFIMKLGYNFSYTSRSASGKTSNYGTNAYAIRGGVETSGSLLYGISNLFRTSRNAENQYTLFNIAYAQFVKGDFDFSKSFRIDRKNSVALHFGFGIAYPYGNSTILPFEKRYFSGGANSVRGWSVRGLGPGSFKGTDGRIDFINQTGDVKLDMNIEYRTHLFWKLDAALFVDAGNIWTLRDYKEQPGGQFRFDTFWKQIAVAYGLGVRLNFNYFILRLDMGMKAVNPAYTSSYYHYPLIHPHFKRDSNWHFAVGLPF